MPLGTLGIVLRRKGNCILTLNEGRELIPKLNFPKVSKKLVRGEIEEYSKRMLRSFRIFSSKDAKMFGNIPSTF